MWVYQCIFFFLLAGASWCKMGQYIEENYGLECNIKAIKEDYEQRKGYYHCPDSNWRSLIQEFDPSSNKTALVTGCNKGFDGVEFLVHYSPPHPFMINMSSKNWWTELQRLTTNKIGCGACSQCKTRFSSKRLVGPQGNQMKPRIYCIEAMPITASLTKAAAKNLGYDERGLMISNGAFIGSQAINRINVGNSSLADETLQVGKGGAIVPATTVDKWANDMGIDILDFLILDTEGFDPKVLWGAAALLGGNRVRLLEFEVHTVGEWKHIRVADVLDYLDNVGMVCFLCGQHHIWRITGCWDETLFSKYKFWNNIVCAPITDPIGKPFLPILEELDQVPSRRKLLGTARHHSFLR